MNESSPEEVRSNVTRLLHQKASHKSAQLKLSINAAFMWTYVLYVVVITFLPSSAYNAHAFVLFSKANMRGVRRKLSRG